jgi:hypothetical protein
MNHQPPSDTDNQSFSVYNKNLSFQWEHQQSIVTIHDECWFLHPKLRSKKKEKGDASVPWQPVPYGLMNRTVIESVSVSYFTLDITFSEKSYNYQLYVCENKLRIALLIYP